MFWSVASVTPTAEPVLLFEWGFFLDRALWRGGGAFARR
jgi:hypothetical protein